MTDEESNFTKEEIKSLKELLDADSGLQQLLLADARRQWLASSIKGIAIWITAIIVGWSATKNAIVEIFGKGS